MFTLALTAVSTMFKSAKFWIIAASLIAIIGAATITYFSWEHSIQQAALLQYNQAQLVQTVQQQKDFITQQQAIVQSEQQLSQQMIDQNVQMQLKLQSLDTYLASDEAKKGNKPASIILQKTIQLLQQGGQTNDK